MAYELRKLAIFGAIGFLLATSIILAMQLYTPYMPGPLPWAQTGEAKSLLIIKVKDAPAPELTALFLKINDVQVHREGKGGGEGTWIHVPVINTDWFNLMALVNDDLATVLAAEELPVGSYTEVRLHVTDAKATIDTTPDIPLKILPETGWLMVKIHFTLEEKVVSQIVVDIDVNEEPVVRAKILSPVVKATVEYIKYKPICQNHYRWVNDIGDPEPPAWNASQDSPISERVASTGAVLRIRLSIKNRGETVWSGVQLKLQYNTSRQGDWVYVDAQGGAGIWRYYNGLGTDKAAVANLYLEGSTIKEHFVESSPTETIVDIPIGGQGEWDICIQSNGADAGKTYYFRFVLWDGTPLDAYAEYPTLTVAG